MSCVRERYFSYSASAAVVGLLEVMLDGQQQGLSDTRLVFDELPVLLFPLLV